MSYSVWANFVYYQTGGIASYGGNVYEALQPNINVLPTTLAPNWQVLPGSSGGVSSLEGLVGAVTQSVVSGGSYANVGNDIQLTITPPVSVSSLEGLVGAVTMSVVSGGSYANVGNDIQLTITPPVVLPSGLIRVSTLTWQQVFASTAWFSILPVPGLTTNGRALATIQVFDINNPLIVEAETNWLVATYCGTNVLVFITAGNPQTNSFDISWLITAL